MLKAKQEAAELVEAAEELEELEGASLEELRDACRKYELDNKGDKQQLIERAQAFLAEMRLAEAVECEVKEQLQSTDETGAAAGRELQKQLLAAFNERALNAGKVAFLKRLSPIVSKAVGAGYPNPNPNPNP